MTLTRLHVLKPLDNELTTLVVAVKMQVQMLLSPEHVLFFIFRIIFLLLYVV